MSHGCPDGLMSYSLPDGHLMIYRGLDVYFNDSVYDGTVAERSEFPAISVNKNINCGSGSLHSGVAFSKASHFSFCPPPD